jgi:hypothetical protein
MAKGPPSGKFLTMKSSPALVVLLLVALSARLPAAQQRVFFAPSATDPAITAFNNNHYAVVDPAVSAKGRIVVFLPGTGGVPFLYTLFVQNAASLGFHALGLMYPNANAINELCAQNDPLNPNAAGDARLEVIDGPDRVPYLAVDRTNSVENRLLKALQYLQATYPASGASGSYHGTPISARTRHCKPTV